MKPKLIVEQSSRELNKIISQRAFENNGIIFAPSVHLIRSLHPHKNLKNYNKLFHYGKIKDDVWRGTRSSIYFIDFCYYSHYINPNILMYLLQSHICDEIYVTAKNFDWMTKRVKNYVIDNIPEILI